MHVPEPAAIFDLDRTLLRGASGPIINDALKELGLRNSQIPGEGLLYKVYDRFGENPLGMALARAAAFAVRGWPVDRLRAAGRLAAEMLMENVAGYAPALLAEHKKSGHILVLATTTPYDLVKPLADRLGIDEVVATRYAWTDGVYTGRLEGGFVWGVGKLTAVRKWAEWRGVDLAESFAYSDSSYDLPLLSAVGNPRAVNPDMGLHAAAVLRRWPILHLDVPPGVPTVGGLEAFDVGKLVIRPELFPYARFDLEGVELIPDDGPFILVSNHRSYFDVAALAVVIARRGRPVRFLGKKELFDAPIVGQMARALGGIPVERAGAAADSLVAAERVLEAGEGLAILPQGTIPRGKAFFDPELRGKTGAARLAARTGAQVVPVGLWNTEAVWPRSGRLPKITNVLNPPLVTVRVGPPIHDLALGPTDAVADTERIMRAISVLLPPEAREVREPSEEELARTYPKGKVGEERAVGVSPVAEKPAPAKRAAPAKKAAPAKRASTAQHGAVAKNTASGTKRS
ncbi:MAG: HAD-IB family hydrolase [Acidimicrobiales bacterium]